MPTGTIPTPSNTKPINTPKPPQYSYAVRKPSIHVHSPKIYDAPNTPKHETFLVISNNDNGSNRRAQIHNVIFAAVQTYHTAFSDNQATPPIQSAATKTKPNTTATARRSAPIVLRNDSSVGEETGLL